MEQPAPELKHDLSSRERKLAVCSGSANLNPADRAEILVMLSNDADETVRSKPKMHCNPSPKKLLSRR
jgi:hypothetical protein